MTLKQAAEFLGRTPVEVQRLITAGDISCRTMPNTGGVMVPREDLVAYLKSRGEWTKFKKSVQPKLVMVEPDFNKGLMMKSDLERGGNLRAKVVANESELEREMASGGVDMVAIRLLEESPLSEAMRLVLDKVDDEEAPVKLFIYHGLGPDLLTRKPEIQKQFTELGVDAVVAYTARMQPVLEKIREIFGVKPPTTGPAGK